MLLVLTASPAGRAAPQKLAYQEIAHQGIASHAADSERRETGSQRGTLPHTPSCASPVRVMGLAALCDVHISAVKCTILHKGKISTSAKTPHNSNKSLGLRRNWL